MTTLIRHLRRLHKSAQDLRRLNDATPSPEFEELAKAAEDQAFIAMCLASAGRDPWTGALLPAHQWLPPARAGADPRQAWKYLVR